MATFIYEAMDSLGKTVKGEVEGTSQEDAINKIRAMGRFPTEVDEKADPIEVQATHLRRKLNIAEPGAPEKNSRPLVGGLIVIAGALLGLYLALWVCFIGGIVQVVEGIKAAPVDAFDVAVGILRFCATAIVGWGSFLVVGAIGAMFGMSQPKKKG